MEIKDFFEFSNNYVMSTVMACAVGLKTDENGKDDHWKLIRGDYEKIDFPVVFKQEHGKKLTDTLGTGWPSLYLISDRMKKILEENQLTGWKTFPVKVYDKKGNEIFGYHGFSILGSCGPIDYSKSEIIEKSVRPNRPPSKYYKGLYVGLDQWDGTDFFMPPKTYEIIVTKKAADVLKKNKITKIQLENLADEEIWERSVSKKISE